MLKELQANQCNLHRSITADQHSTDTHWLALCLSRKSTVPPLGQSTIVHKEYLCSYVQLCFKPVLVVFYDYYLSCCTSCLNKILAKFYNVWLYGEDSLMTDLRWQKMTTFCLRLSISMIWLHAKSGIIWNRNILQSEYEVLRIFFLSISMSCLRLLIFTTIFVVYCEFRIILCSPPIGVLVFKQDL